MFSPSSFLHTLRGILRRCKSHSKENRRNTLASTIGEKYRSTHPFYSPNCELFPGKT